ncbi:MAG: hypothetical protein HY283_01655 [Nitrospirae bacterium]|nr:hypothetical protein [Nitrospirota bacterium]
MKTNLKNERGMALVVAMMLLVLMTVMGLAAISTTSTEIQITSNERTDGQAFQAAEAGIKEALFRASLPKLGTNTIANGGSYATVDGVTMDAYLADPGVAGNPTAGWEYDIYLGAPPAGAHNVRSIMPTKNQPSVNYLKDNSGKDSPVVIRYVTEMDLKNWGIANADLNGDGDYMDLVYYNGDSKNPLRVGAGTKTAGVMDVAPPAGSSKNLAIWLVQAVGHSGKATKNIQLETTGFPVNPNANAAVEAGIAVDMAGSGFISGFNHSENTVVGDSAKVNTGLYSNNNCDNYSQVGTGTCGLATDPDNVTTTNCTGSGKTKVCTTTTTPYQAAYSGMATLTDSAPAIISTASTKQTGAAVQAWGGNSDSTVGWQKVDPNYSFPSLASILGVDPTLVDPTNPDSILAHASTDPNACPSGVTYIDNAASAQDYMPNKIAGCPAGSGILIVTGNMKITSQFEFRGLVYVMGDATLNGGAWLLGSLAVKGVTQGLKVAAGNPTILYSKNAVNNAVQAALQQVGFAFTTLSWREY